MLATAFVHNGHNCRPSAARWNTPIQNQYHIRRLPNLPHRTTILAPLSAKQQQDDKDKDAASENQSSSSSWFKRKDKSEDPKSNKDDDAEGKSKGIPLVGRFFATDEEKEEKRRIKKEEKDEKERLKREAKEEKKKRELERNSNSNNNENANEIEPKSSKLVPSVRNYFQERQERKDAEALRFQVKRMEEERQKQLENDAEELRLAVQQKEADRKRVFAEYKKKVTLKLPSASVVTNDDISDPSKDIVRKKIRTQKELDKQRKERQKKIQASRGSGIPANEKSPKSSKSNSKAQGGETDSEKPSGGSSKSQRFGGMVAAAQKLVAGVFDSDSEEWIVVAPKTRISPGEIVAVTAAGIDLLLIASKDGSAVHCVANSCPHLGTPLEIGSQERRPIESSESLSSKQADVQPVQKESSSFFRETDIASMLTQDGCEDCIVCPLHKTAFALKSGEVRGEWCPYPPVIGKLTGAVKQKSNLPIFDLRTKGKNIEVRLNTPVEIGGDDDPSQQKKKR